MISKLLIGNFSKELNEHLVTCFDILKRINNAFVFLCLKNPRFLSLIPIQQQVWVAINFFFKDLITVRRIFFQIFKFSFNYINFIYISFSPTSFQCISKTSNKFLHNLIKTEQCLILNLPSNSRGDEISI